MLSRKRGFTLIELLIVIAIILILIAIALPNFLEAQTRAKVTKAAGEIRSIATAQESYYTDWKSYTHDCFSADAISTPGGGPPFLLGCVALTTPIPYMKELPRDSFGIHESTSGQPVELRGDPFYPMGTGINPSTEQKLGVYNAPFSQQNPPFREAYIIYSAGPSLIEPGNPTRTFPVTCPSLGTGGGSSFVNWTIYSPTNGTKSFGGIIRTGGVRLECPEFQTLNTLAHN